MIDVVAGTGPDGLPRGIRAAVEPVPNPASKAIIRAKMAESASFSMFCRNAGPDRDSLGLIVHQSGGGGRQETGAGRRRGSLESVDWRANESAARRGGWLSVRLFSVYHSSDGVKFYIITRVRPPGHHQTPSRRRLIPPRPLSLPCNPQACSDAWHVKRLSPFATGSRGFGRAGTDRSELLWRAIPGGTSHGATASEPNRRSRPSV